MVQVGRIGGRGGWGGEVISAMPERKHFFYRRASLSLKNTFLTIKTVWEVEIIGFDRNMMDRVVWGDFSLVSIFPFCQTFSQIFYGHSSDWVLGMSTVN